MCSTRREIDADRVSALFIAFTSFVGIFACDGSGTPCSFDGGATCTGGSDAADVLTTPGGDWGTDSSQSELLGFQDSNGSDGNLGVDGDPDCIPQCGLRLCGPDPICDKSCGTCASGLCNVEGACIQADGPPQILSFSANFPSVAPSQPVEFSLLISDPQGMGDVVSARMETPLGKPYGTFAPTGQEGRFVLAMTWNQVGDVEPINTAAGGSPRTFRAVVLDKKNQQATATIDVMLKCGVQGQSACNGACFDLSKDLDHCGACNASCSGPDPQCDGGECSACPTSAPNICGSTCVDLQTDRNNCGTCGHKVGSGSDKVCAAGQIACTPGLAMCGNYCDDLDTSEYSCGACGNSCKEFAEGLGQPDYLGSCTKGKCGVRVEFDPQASCNTHCGSMGLSCGLKTTFYGQCDGWMSGQNSDLTAATCAKYTSPGGCADADLIVACGAIPAPALDKPYSCAHESPIETLLCFCHE